MFKNTDLRSIGETLEQAESVLLFPHVHPDGDCMGSSVALCSCLRSMGKKADIIMEDDLPSHIGFLDEGYCLSHVGPGGSYDVTICIDCSEEKRFSGSKEIFLKGKKRICIDHHHAEECTWDMYYIDPAAAATCEIIYDLFEEMGWQVDEKCAKALYTGISSDTGGFRYSNTTSRTHAIAAELMKKGIDTVEINVNLFQNIDPREIAVIIRSLDNMEIFSGGKAAIATLTGREMEACDAEMEHTETVINWLRDIEGVEIAAFLKEDGGKVRTSLRAKSWGNVESIARAFGGGGHIKAAGCTLDMPIGEACKKIKKAMEESLSDQKTLSR